MPVLKVKKNGIWEEIIGSSGGNADTLDGNHASDFVFKDAIYDYITYSKFFDYINKYGSAIEQQFATKEYVDDIITENISTSLSAKTLSDHLNQEMMILSSQQCGYELPPAGNKGRIFFLLSNE